MVVLYAWHESMYAHIHACMHGLSNINQFQRNVIAEYDSGASENEKH
jgi:hypothetical protein